MAKLTDKQKRFVDEYLIDMNATAAAIRAGYSEKTAQEQSSRMLLNVIISEHLAKRRASLEKRTEVSQDKVIKELAKIGFANMTDYLDYKTMLRETGQDANGDIIHDWAMSVVAKDSSEVDGSPIQEVSISKDGTFKFKLYSKLDALEKIGRYLGMFDKPPDDTTPKALERLDRIIEGISDAAKR